jgi:hypothetical protein
MALKGLEPQLSAISVLYHMLLCEFNQYDTQKYANTEK